MPPLHRCPSTQSVLSWWSDSNPPGATIPLHALAKPLMKLLYHQQASAVLARDNDSSLSKERVELLLAYVQFKYVSVGTKIKVLRHLAIRAQSLVDARAIIDGQGITEELLASQDSGILDEVCATLANICAHSALIPSVVALKLVPNLVQLVRSSHEPIRYHTMVSLRRLFYWSHAAAKEAVDAGVLNDMVGLLDVDNPGVVAWVCRILGSMVLYPDLNDAIIALRPCNKLASVLNTTSEDATRHAIYVLCHISDRSAASVVDANILAKVEPLLDSTDPRVISYTCCLLGNLQRRIPNVISAELRCRLSSLLMASGSMGADGRMSLAAAYALGHWGIETRYD
ncbi:armadillo-type protein [Mycena vitilis]|nr:armadillo-type protein [Mycena vitilis]